MFVIPLLTRLQQRLATGIPHLECLNVHFEIPKALASLGLRRRHFQREEYALDSLAELSQITGLLPFLLGQIVQSKRDSM